MLPATTTGDSLWDSYTTLQYRYKALKREVEEFHNGQRYKKLQEDHRRVIAGYIRENKRLKQEAAAARAEANKILNTWAGEREADWEEYNKALDEKDQKIQELQNNILELQIQADEREDELRKKYEEQLAEKDAVIAALENELAHAKALLGRDGTNTGMPTSQTPLDKNKRVPNTREKSGKPKGGQEGHKKHTLDSPSEDEINDVVEHAAGDDDTCPKCGSGSYEYVDEEARYEYDIEVKVIKRKHIYYKYKCLECGTEFWTKDKPAYKAECQYGPMVRALILSLMGNVNAPMNKVAMFMRGISDGEITPSESYIAKQQKRAYEMLEPFEKDLYRRVIAQSLLYWDDTVIMVQTKRSCLRFYGNEKIAYFTAHAGKGFDGLDEDNVLNVLTADTTVMHDHNAVNYNPKYHFKNIECNEHLLRDCQKAYDRSFHPEWLCIKQHISTAIHQRNEMAQRGETSFSEEFLRDFRSKIDENLQLLQVQNEADSERYFASAEKALITRIAEYWDNYFAWMRDFSLPVTNNLSERGLRGVKSHMKISGQFESVMTASYYARIRLYLETCRKNGFNEMTALVRLAEGNPYTVDEILGD